MTQVINTLAAFCGYALVAVFVENAVLGRALGISRLVKLVDDSEVNSLTFCILLTAVQVTSVPLAWAVNRTWLVNLDYANFVRPLAYVICMIISFVVILILVAVIFPPKFSKRAISVLPMATFNCCIAGTLLLTTIRGFNIYQTLGFALGTGLGYTAVVFVLTEGDRRLNDVYVPESLRGLPINLLYLSILSMAVYGMTGHMLSF